MRPWFHRSRTRALALTMLVLHALPAACASRTVPPQFPPTAAASSAAAEGHPAIVTAALTEDPPLPGQPTTRWPGLRDDHEPQPTAHGGHHGHH